VAHYYEILGLADHPVDLKTVKRAYAKQLRITRPDDDPEGFMKLREAFDIAKQEIAYRAYDAVAVDSDTPLTDAADNVEISPQNDQERKTPSPQIILSDDVVAEPTSDDSVALEETPPEPEMVEEIEHTGDQILMGRLSKAFKDPFLKNDKAHWASILDDKASLSIDEYIDFDERLRNALVEAYNQWIEEKKENSTKRRPFSNLIENLIFDKMDWRFLQETDSYKAQQINWLKSQMDLFNCPAPKHVRDAWKMSQQQTPEFEDDSLSGPMILWNIIRVILVVVVISNILSLFSG